MLLNFIPLLLDGPTAVFIIGGFFVLVVLPLAALGLLIWFFIKRAKQRNRDKTV